MNIRKHSFADKAIDWIDYPEEHAGLLRWLVPGTRHFAIDREQSMYMHAHVSFARPLVWYTCSWDNDPEFRSNPD